MNPRLAPTLGALVALMMAAGYVHAFSTQPPAPANAAASDEKPPMDCKKQPDDPRCKDQKKKY